MFKALRARHPGAGLGRVLWRYAVEFVLYGFMVVCYRYRSWGGSRIPREGPVLFISNHQSILDPVLIAVGGEARQFYALARSTLWANRAFGWFISSLNTVPVKQGVSDTGAMRRAIEMLKQGHGLLVFAEGTRTVDGEIKEFASGTMLLIKRARPVVVPVAVEGLFDVWPKGRALPRLWGRIGVEFGEPIAAEELIAMGAREGLNELRARVEEMRRSIAVKLKT